jgi:hypothetical protein
MKKILEKKIDQIYVILVLFIVVVGGLVYFENKSKQKLIQTNELLKITIEEAVSGGVSADSLKDKYHEYDSLNNKR